MVLRHKTSFCFSFDEVGRWTALAAGEKGHDVTVELDDSDVAQGLHQAGEIGEVWRQASPWPFSAFVPAECARVWGWM